MASAAPEAARGEEFSNVEIYRNARTDYKVPIAVNNKIIHLKGFGSYLDFEKHTETKELGKLLLDFVVQKLTKNFSSITIVWDGDPYDRHSFTALIPRLYDALLPRKIFLVAFVQGQDKYNTKDSFLKSYPKLFN